MLEAKDIAQELGNVTENNAELQKEIDRLRRKNVVELEQVNILHNWLENKRQSGQSCRVVGESRTGKTVACNSYRLRHRPTQITGQSPIIPVVYIQPPQECGSKELFMAILEHLKYQFSKGTISEIRERTYRGLNACKVEMLIIDEADRIKPKTFADVRDIFDKLSIAVVLVGTSRLDTVIRRDEQVFNRFRACYSFGRLSGEELKDIVATWETEVLRLPVPSNLTSKAMLQVLGQTTSGYIGLLDMILREAAIRALQKGLNRIDIDTLKEVAKEFK